MPRVFVKADQLQDAERTAVSVALRTLQAYIGGYVEIFCKMPEQTIKFVQLIEEFPCLWNNTLEEYSRKHVTEKAWSTVAKKMLWSVADSKERWKNIRNAFVRSLKPYPGGSSSKTKKPYYLHDLMRFILPYVRPVQPKTESISLSDTEITTQLYENESQLTQNTFMESTEEYNNDVTVEPLQRIRESRSSVGHKKKKRKRIGQNNDVDHAVLDYIRQKKHKKKPNCDRQMFLLSLLPDVSSLSQKNLRQFKIKTLLLLEELLAQQEQPTAQHYDSLQLDHLPTYDDSTVSRCSSSLSINDTGSTASSSPIRVIPTQQLMINDVKSIPHSTPKVTDPLLFREN